MTTVAFLFCRFLKIKITSNSGLLIPRMQRSRGIEPEKGGEVSAPTFYRTVEWRAIA